MMRRLRIQAFLPCLIVASFTSVGKADHKDDIGLTALIAELGASAPTGTGISISQVEAPVSPDYYYADTTESQLSDKILTLKSGSRSGTSYHANFVAFSYCGGSNGIAPGITQIDAYDVNGWLQSDFLRFDDFITPPQLQPNLAPVVEQRRIQNHSWATYEYGDATYNQDIVRRFDYAIVRDGFVAVVGLNNGNTTDVPPLLASAYNAISVGNANGNHSSGGTTNDTAGRLKPEIVAPSGIVPGAVSYSCGTVSGAAALLLETADDSPGLVNARTNSEVTKALVLAGADKSPFPGWTRTPTQPLDLVYGAGRLNIQNSYHLLVAGEHDASGSATVTNCGWDFDSTTSSPARYFFDVPTGYSLTNFSVILTWNRVVTDGAGPGFGNLQATVADLDLRLYTATGFTLGTQLDSSISTIQNVEHIFTSLGSGRYALEVTSDTTGTDYALAWGGTLRAQISTSVNQPTWGTVSPPTGNYSLGIALSFVASPATYYLFDHWSGALTGTNNPVPVTVSTNMTVTAVFVEQLTTNHPTPYWWLAQYGYTSNQETVITNLGANGYPLWQSYIAGLVPTNPASQLRFTSQTLLSDTNLVLTWDTVTGRVYTVWNGTNAAGNFTTLPGAVDLPATVQSLTNPITPGAPRQFFLLEVEKP